MKDRDAYGAEFDEDLSELEDAEEEHTDDPEKCKDPWCCHCEGECECGAYDYDRGGDEMSERSYEGSDAGHYYELKEKREKRKREVLQERKEKKLEWEFVRTKEDEVRAAYESLQSHEKKGETVPVKSLPDQSLQLFCSDSVEYFYRYIAPTVRVDFYYEPSQGDSDDPEDNTNSPNPDIPREYGVEEDEAGVLHGFVYLNASIQCHFGPFHPPKRASQSPVTLKSDNGHELSFTFFGSRYPKLTLSREMMSTYMTDTRHPSPLPPTAPEVFEFVGIWRDQEKEEAQWLEAREGRA